MKKVKFILPLVAVMVAVVGVFATGNSEVAFVSVDAHASTITTNCNVDGTCDQTSQNTCTLISGYVFNKVIVSGGTTCSTPATGVFHL